MSALRPICVKCRLEMRCVKNNRVVADPQSGEFPSTYWLGDEYECPECRLRIVTGFGGSFSTPLRSKSKMGYFHPSQLGSVLHFEYERAEGGASCSLDQERKTITADHWQAEGERLFGPDMLQWRFVCPICGNVQTPSDFRQHKETGATADCAYKECIGRYRMDSRSAFRDSEGSPCDYAAYGLFRVAPVHIEGWKYPIFDFDRSGEEGGGA